MRGSFRGLGAAFAVLPILLASSPSLRAQENASDQVSVVLPQKRLAFGITANGMNGKDIPDDAIYGAGIEMRYMTKAITVEVGGFAAPVPDPEDPSASGKKLKAGLSLGFSFNVVRKPTTRVFLGFVAEGMFKAVPASPEPDNLMLVALQVGVAQRLGRHIGLYLQTGPGLGGAANGDEVSFAVASKAGVFFF